jgi:hypothetical protein
MTSASTLEVTFSEEEAAVIMRAQRDGVAQFTSAIDTVMAQFKGKYDAEDRGRLLTLFGSADIRTREAVFGLLEP